MPVLIDNAFILAGGFGRRLGNITKKVPKPLININGKPFLEFLIEQLVRAQIKKIYILTYYKHQQFKKKYHLKKVKNSQILCIKEKTPSGTAGAIYYSKKKINNKTLVLNGDTYLQIPFTKLLKINLKNKNLFMLLLKNKNYKSNKKLSNLRLKKNEVYFSKNKKNNLMNSGLYLINKKIIKYLKNKKSLENDVMPDLIDRKLVIGDKYNKKFIDVGLKKNLNQFKIIMKSKK